MVLYPSGDNLVPTHMVLYPNVHSFIHQVTLCHTSAHSRYSNYPI